MTRTGRPGGDESGPRAFLLVSLFAVVFLSCAGCVSVLTQTGGEGVASGTGNATALRAVLVRQDVDWGLSRGCAWEASFQVYNAGSTGVRNVQLHVELVNADTGAVRDAKDIYVGTIGPGEEKTATIELDGECLDQYTVRAIPIANNP